MKYRLLDLLVCPFCKKRLALTPLREETVSVHLPTPAETCSWCAFLSSPHPAGSCQECYTKNIIDGMLSCSCGSAFPIIDSVPILLSESRHHFKELQGKYGTTAVAGYWGHERDNRASDKTYNRTKRRFGYEWLRYPVCFEEEEENIFREEIQIDVSHFRNKRVLDAGCGMGRFTRIAARFGGEVFGVDLSDSVFKAREITQAFPSVHIVQADLLRLPFPEHCFDIIYSFGVLHHTPDTKHAFCALVEKLKAGGFFSLWVYGKAGNYKNFVTNPLKKERAKFIVSPFMHRIYWLLVLLRGKFSSAVRIVTVNLPHPLLYIFCYVLALLGKLPVIKYLTFSTHKDWRVRLLENFDWLSPPFQYHHTKEEVSEWFKEEHIAVQSILEHGFIPKIGLSGIRKQ